MNVTTVMLSHVSRASTERPLSLASAHTAGLKPLIIESTAIPPSDAEVRRQGYAALEAAQGGALLFLEDDIRFNPDRFHKHLRLAVKARVTTAFCAVGPHHYPPGLTRRGSLPLSLVPIPNYDARSGYHGSMALYIPREMVEYGVMHPEQFMQPDGSTLVEPIIKADFECGLIAGFDCWVKNTAPQFGGMLVAIPNSVDHVGRNLSTGNKYPSATFHTREAA